MLFPSLGTHICGAEFQYPDRFRKEICGMMANLVAKSGDKPWVNRKYPTVIAQ
jgi:hypothetical protein